MGAIARCERRSEGLTLTETTLPSPLIYGRSADDLRIDSPLNRAAIAAVDYSPSIITIETGFDRPGRTLWATALSQPSANPVESTFTSFTVKLHQRWNPMANSIDVEQLAERIASESEPPQLIDVREPEELEIVALDGFLNLPMSRASEWVMQAPHQLDPHGETFVMCHHGVRSAYACQWLQEVGFTNVWNVSGGIDAYAIRVDRDLPRY